MDSSGIYIVSQALLDFIGPKSRHDRLQSVLDALRIDALDAGPADRLLAPGARHSNTGHQVRVEREHLFAAIALAKAKHISHSHFLSRPGWTHASHHSSSLRLTHSAHSITASHITRTPAAR